MDVRALIARHRRAAELGGQNACHWGCQPPPAANSPLHNLLVLEALVQRNGQRLALVEELGNGVLRVALLKSFNLLQASADGSAGEVSGEAGGRWWRSSSTLAVAPP